MMLSITPEIMEAPPDISFFEAEEREGFFVSSMMKRYWAAQLKVLYEIDRVCRKHDIRWFSDCGTLLGAVRHGGYIPWDDDLDICMLRHDWLRFFDVAKSELPQGYCLLNLNLEKDYDHLLGRVVNAHAIEFGPEHMKEYFGCPYSVGIDIFPLDGLCDDEEKEEERRSLLNDIKKAYDLAGSGKLEALEFKRLLSDIEGKAHTTFKKSGNIFRQLLLLTEKLYMMYPSKNAKNVALMPFWVSNHDHKYSKELFKDTVMLPFEYTWVRVPARYDEVLKIEYGSYMSIHKGGGAHDYPVYKEQEAMLRRNNNANPYRFTLTEDALRSFHREKTTKEKCLEMTDTLLKAHDEAQALSVSGEKALCGQVLVNCQTLAISLGTHMENNMPKSEKLVHMLEDYCEMVYAASTAWDENTAGGLNSAIMGVSDAIVHYFSAKKKTVLFLPCKAAWWKSMEPIYDTYRALAEFDVKVMPLSYLSGDRLTGINGGAHNDAALFPDGMNLVSPQEYDIAAQHPDIIMTQYPYDNWSSTMDVPEFFYSKNLTAHTDRLVYVPCFDVDPPVDENDKAAEAIKVMIEQPAVVYSDEVLVSSEAMKKLYVDTLTDIAGERDYWEKKIVIFDKEKALSRKEAIGGKDLPKGWQDKAKGRKILLFGVNAAFLLENGAAAIEKLKRSISMMEAHPDKLLCVFEPGIDIDEIRGIDPALRHSYHEFADSIKDKENVIYDNEHEAEKYLSHVSAYYGTAGNTAHKCRNLGKPVMIMSMV